MRHEGVGYSLLGSDTAICGISVEGKAESQRSNSGVTWEVQRAFLEHRGTETRRVYFSVF